MAVLETSELAFSIAHSKDEVACSFCCLHAVDRLIEGLIPLQNISQDESKRIAKSTLLAKSIIRIGDSNL